MCVVSLLELTHPRTDAQAQHFHSIASIHIDAESPPPFSGGAVVAYEPHAYTPSHHQHNSMVSRLLRPVLHWTQETLRVAGPALAATARGTLGAAMGSVAGGRDTAEARPQPMALQRRHRWAGTKEFGTETAVSYWCGCWGG